MMLVSISFKIDIEGNNRLKKINKDYVYEYF